MKKHITNIIKIQFGIMLLNLTACSLFIRPSGPKDFTYVSILKFYDPSYKNQILAYSPPNKHSEDAWAYMFRFNMCASNPYHSYDAQQWIYAFPESHHLPYWELTDDWFLIDWRWHNFPYDKATSVVINQQWDDLYNSSWSWSSNDFLDDDPIAELINVPIKKISAVLNKEYSHMVQQVVRAQHSLDYYLEDDVYGYDFCLCEAPNVMDSVWSVLQTDLSTYIDAGGLQNNK